jgi:hypothetical protein
VYAEPYLTATNLTVEGISELLSKSFATWDEWRDEVALLAAAQMTKQEVAVVRTAVKTTWTLPRLNHNMVTMVDASDELGLELEDRLRLLSLVVEELEKLDGLRTEPGWDTLGDGEKKNITACINLLQVAVKELHEMVVSSVKELQLGFGVRLRSVEFLIGGFSKSAFEGSLLMGIVEDMQLQLDTINGSEFVLRLLGKTSVEDGRNDRTGC